MKYYMLSDNLNQSERDRFGISIKDSFAISRRTIDGIIVRAVKTDSFRAPRKGEWYLSGSTPTATHSEHHEKASGISQDQHPPHIKPPTT